MRTLPVCIVLLSCALIEGCVGAIQCYTCDDCQVVNDTLLQLCPSDVGTVAATVAPNAVTEQLLTTSAPETTAVADDTEPVTEEAADDAGEGGEAPTVEPDPAEAEPVEADPSEVEPLEADPGGAEPVETVAAEEEEPESESLVVSPDIISNLNITRRKRESTSGSISYHCFSVQHDDDRGRKKTKRGCIAVLANASACVTLKEEYGASDKNCKICSKDKCNSGVVMKHSLAAALLVVVNSLMQW